MMQRRRRGFYSFDYKRDAWRAAQIRNMKLVDGNSPVTDNAWETVTRGGNAAIRRWINDQMKGRTCTIVLIGHKTAGRKWINYEIKKSWDDQKGLLGIYIDILKDQRSKIVPRGRNPFEEFSVDNANLSDIVKVYGARFRYSKNLYAHIRKNIADWVEEAIEIRRNF